MTKEQEESIEYLKKHIKYFEEQIKSIEAIDCDYYDEELELYRNRVKQFNIVLSILKEKDKQIDSMVEYISEHADCPCENEGKNLDCEKMCDVRIDRDCWKIYFENKVKERNND